MTAAVVVRIDQVSDSGDSEALRAENALLEAQLDGLHRALRSRATIEQAKGVLMAFARCSESAAFALLSRLSQERNVRIRVLAEHLLTLAETGFPPADEDTVPGWLRSQVLDLTRAPGQQRPAPPRTVRR